MSDALSPNIFSLYDFALMNSTISIEENVTTVEVLTTAVSLHVR
jgi:hypothetical protein